MIFDNSAERCRFNSMEPAKLLEEDSSGKPKSGEPSPSHTFSGTEMRRDHESVDDFEHLDPESSPIKEAVGEVKSDSLDKLVLLDHQESETTASSSNLESNISPGFSFVSEQKFDHSPKDVSPLPSEDKSSQIIEETEASVLDASDDAKIEIQKSSAEQSRNELEEHHDILKALNDLPRPPTFESVPDVKHDLNEPSTDSLPVDNASADVSTSNSFGTESKTEPPEEVSQHSFEPPPIAPVSSISLKRDELVAEEKDLSDKDDDSSFVMAQRDHFYDKNSTEDLLNLSRDISSNLNIMPSAPLEEPPSESVYSQSRAGIIDTHDVFYSDEETTHHQEMKPEESTKTETSTKPEETVKSKPKEEEIAPKSQSAVSKESSGDEELTLLTSP
ncbi:hypothetical protein J437_LFUL012955 [Ladona fulva]|uniref:Uncharacterized protein n=1 Tax=Ladona fulva TaxID=123851 RepID=A0A8K0P6E9_LADFU|nr:hypothetical protein J437_LFUL012955 [Ladona fulva]